MSDCILTTFNLNIGGYGRVTVNGAVMNHHRLAYLTANNLSSADIAGKVVRHTCDNRACVNPLHLVLGTHKDNMADKKLRGRPNGGGARVVLTTEQVADIRTTFSLDQYQLAVKYGVSQATINNVKQRKYAYSK